MTDVNEQSFSAGTNSDSAAAHAARPLRNRSRPPIWRFRPTLPPVNVVQTLRTQIIPRIVLALRSAPAVKTHTTADQKPLSNVEQFTALALGNHDDPVLAYVENLIHQGASIESIFVDLLAPASRHLGELWESDATDFANVSLAMSRIQRILRVLGERFFSEGNRGDCGDSALLTTIPGEQHSFGLSMVAEFFRRAGWNLCTGPFSSHQELTSLVHNHWFDVIGFSVSSDRKLDELRRDIDHIRRDSRNKNVGILLGGPMLAANPQLVASVGADMMSVDATTAPQQARLLIDRIKSRI